MTEQKTDSFEEIKKRAAIPLAGQSFDRMWENPQYIQAHNDRVNLLKRIAELEDFIKLCRAEGTKNLKEIEILTNALEFYGFCDNWEDVMCEIKDHHSFMNKKEDHEILGSLIIAGKQARKALAEAKKLK